MNINLYTRCNPDTKRSRRLDNIREIEIDLSLLGEENGE